MKFTIIVMALSAILGSAIPSHAQVKLEMEWVRDIGSDASHETVFSTVVDTKGNAIVLARTWDGGSGPARDIFKVQKYNAAGEFVWQKELKGAMEQGMLPGGLCVDSSDNIFFLLNTFNKSFYFDTILFNCPNWESSIFKLSANGDLVWTKQVDRLVSGWAMEDNTELLAIDHNNDLVFTGRSQSSDSTFKIDGIPYFRIPVYGAFFVAKFTGGGDVLWAKQIDQHTDDSSYYKFSQGDFVAIDNDDNIYVFGKFGGAFKYYETELLSEGPLDLFLAKIRPTGELLWVNRIGSNLTKSIDWPWGLAIDEENNAYTQAVVYQDVTISGWSGVSTGSSAPEIFICKFDPFGKVVWNKRIEGLDYRRLGTTVDDCPMGLAYSRKDNSIICRSHLFDTAAIDSTVLNIKSVAGLSALWAYTTDGKLKWAAQISIEEGYAQFNDIVVDNDGNIYMGGYAGEYWSFDRDPHIITIADSTFSTIGGEDGILAKFSLKEFSNVASGKQPIPHLSVFPNPFSERTTIDLPNDVLQTSSTIQIFNVLGIKILEAPLASNDGRHALDRQGMPSGIYQFLVIANKEAFARGEFVIR